MPSDADTASSQGERNMPEDFHTTNGADQDIVAKYKSLILVTYGLFIFFPLIGIIICYVKRSSFRQSMVLDSHIAWLIRTFWFSLIGALIGVLLSFAFIGNVIMFVVSIWYLGRVIKGGLAMWDEKPMGTGWF
jgi:uncharacterized membrane protein